MLRESFYHPVLNPLVTLQMAGKVMKLVLPVLFAAGLMFSCASTQPKRIITDDNYVKFGNPELHLKTSDQLVFQGQGVQPFADMGGAIGKREVWEWKSAAADKGFFILISTLSKDGWLWSGSPNGVWKRDKEYYRSFPETVSKGGQDWYVDVFRYLSFDRVIFGRTIGKRQRIWLCYWQQGTPNPDWKELIEQVEKVVVFLR